MISLLSLNKSDLTELLRPHSRSDVQARYRAKQIFQWVYRRHRTDWDQMSDISKEMRTWLAANVEVTRLSEHHGSQADDGTRKFLWKLHDGKTVESVIIPAALQEKDETDDPGRSHDIATQSASRFAGKRVDEDEASDLGSEHWRRLTACISSQVGCAMACKFCLTGIQGLDRSLTAAEIVAQVCELRRLAPITNIVFMGMGEPLHNLENVIKACQILTDPDGLGFSKRKVTVSTSGLVSGIAELGRQVGVSLAISLNSTTDEQRSQIMPVNKKWNIEALLQACRDFPLGGHRRITFEYVMLKGFNDSLEDAARLFRMLRGIPSKVNLIPFNEHSGSEFKRPDDEVVHRFQRYLVDRRMTATVRISRGRDILAACGQLRSIFGTARGSERHRDWAAASPQAPASAAAAAPAASRQP